MAEPHDPRSRVPTDPDELARIADDPHGLDAMRQSAPIDWVVARLPRTALAAEMVHLFIDQDGFDPTDLAEVSTALDRACMRSGVVIAAGEGFHPGDYR